MITAEQLTKRHGARTVVSDVTFRCEPGTVTICAQTASTAERGTSGT
jgi:hypothetical protein